MRSWRSLFPRHGERGFRPGVEALARSLGAPVLFVVKGSQAYGRDWQRGCSSIGPADEVAVKRQVDAISEGHKRICLCVNGFGGSNVSALNIGHLLRQRFDHLTAYVPHVAASSATLLCLHADRIVMGALGYFTMVDPIVKAGGVYAPASQVLSGGAELLERSNPVEIRVARAAVEAAEYQVQSVLCGAGLEGACAGVIGRLLHGPGGHDTPIRREELLSLGLPIAAGDEHEADLRRMMALILSTAGTHPEGFVCAASP